LRGPIPIEIRLVLQPLLRFLRNAAVWPGFVRDFLRFRSMSRPLPQRLPLRWGDRLPNLDDRTGKTPFDPHYVYHPAWAARILAETRPVRHVDISSTLHFCTIVSAFVPVDFYDYRPAPLELDNLTTGSADLMRLPFGDESVPSLSCMHVLEHVGLGRYGDPLDPEGDLRAARELTRVLRPGGTLLIVVPVGRPRIVYNSHRIYSNAAVLDAFRGLEVREFSLVQDAGAPELFVRGASMEPADRQLYGCGCYWFVKPGEPEI